MLKLLVAFLLGLNTLVAYAQSFTVEKPVACSDPKTVMETMSGPEWKEQPFWIGLGETDSKYVMMVNEKTKTWSFIQFNSTVACVLGTGRSSSLTNFNKIKT